MNIPRSDTYSRLTALIIDDHANQRQQLRWHLTQLGIETVDQAGTALEAVTAMGKKAYDVILCDYNLDSNTRGVVSNGQQLLEHVKSIGVLGSSSIFMMVSGNSSYADIAATVEHKPDAYLVKPISTKILEERLQRLLERQKALSPITARQRVKDFAGAIKAAETAGFESPEYFLNALQLKGGCQLELGLFEEALGTFGEVLAISVKLDWAHYGKARALKGLKRTEDARQALEDLIARNRLYTSAYELLAEMAEEAGDDEEAARVLQRSLAELPSPRRARVLAEVAYRNGDVETARQNYEVALKATKGTFVGRPTDILMVAQAAVDMGDHEDALALVKENFNDFVQDGAVEGVACSIQAQAYAGLGDFTAARKAASRAKTLAGEASACMNSMLIAKGLLAVGDQAGLELVKDSVKDDHENARMLSLARRVLKDSGREEFVAEIVDATAESVRATLTDSQKLRRSGDFMKAKDMVDQALGELPNNTGVLIEAAQVYLLALMRQSTKDSSMIAAVMGFLAKLDKLLPGSERVAAQHAYLRRVLSAPPPAAAPAMMAEAVAA